MAHAFAQQLAPLRLKMVREIAAFHTPIGSS
jgi:hypothetical protein